MSIGNRVKEVRNDYGFTQEQMSRALFVSRSLIGNIESGKATATKRFINDFCQEFRINDEWLVSGEGTKYREDTTHVVNPQMQNPVDDVWDTSTGYIFKYAHITKALADSCNLDDAIWSIFNSQRWVDVLNFIISEFIIPGIRNDAQNRLFDSRFDKAFPEYRDYILKKKHTDSLVDSVVQHRREKHLQDLNSKSIWNDIEKLTFAVMDDPTILGIEKSANIETKVLSHRIYVESKDV